MKDIKCFRGRMCACGLLIFLGLLLGPALANAQTTDKSGKFEIYRTAIKKDYGIDTKDFKDQLKGGKADGKDITKYDLKQILLGIKIEQEHTSNKMIALEIYTRLIEMEEEAEEEMEDVKVKPKK